MTIGTGKKVQLPWSWRQLRKLQNVEINGRLKNVVKGKKLNLESYCTVICFLCYNTSLVWDVPRWYQTQELSVHQSPKRLDSKRELRTRTVLL